MPHHTFRTSSTSQSSPALTLTSAHIFTLTSWLPMFHIPYFPLPPTHLVDASPTVTAAHHRCLTIATLDSFQHRTASAPSYSILPPSAPALRLLTAFYPPLPYLDYLQTMSSRTLHLTYADNTTTFGAHLFHRNGQRRYARAVFFPFLPKQPLFGPRCITVDISALRTSARSAARCSTPSPSFIFARGSAAAADTPAHSSSTPTVQRQDKHQRTRPTILTPTAAPCSNSSFPQQQSTVSNNPTTASHSEPLFLPTSGLPGVTDILPTSGLPGVTLPGGVLPTSGLPGVTDILPTSGLPGVTDILPTSGLPGLTSLLPTATLPGVTDVIPFGALPTSSSLLSVDVELSSTISATWRRRRASHCPRQLASTAEAALPVLVHPPSPSPAQSSSIFPLPRKLPPPL
ncbi:hypothetical protein CF319_g7252 [Tilletia indica]|nr:hypothetical protein CF319_g7252 [Tilletia indica]